MEHIPYRGRREEAIKPSLFLGFGLAFLLLAAALFLFAPLLGFLAALCGCASAACLVYYALRRAVDAGLFIGPAKALIWIMRIAFVAGLVSFIAVECFVISGGHTDAESRGADYLIVLGCGVDGETPSLMLQSRIDAAEEFLKANPYTVAVLSGCQGPGEDISEAEAMRRALSGRGIDDERLLLEQDSRNTIENIRNSLALIPEGSRVAVLSNDFHLCRARLIAGNEGADVSAVSAVTPRADLALCYYIREYFSLAKVFFTYLF